LERKQKHRSKFLGWFSAGCALALFFLSMVQAGLSQDTTSAASKSSAKAAPKTAAKTPTAQAQAKTSPKKPAAKATAAHSGKSKHSGSRKRKAVARGQQKIDPQRAQAIQEALIREHYLSGTAAGTWNESSEEAMRRYQADHGWQSKTVPDSRALISLGLGPSHDHLLNPDSAMTTEPSAPRAASLTPASHSAEPGARVSTNSTVPAQSAPVVNHDQNSNPQ
jgi:hypothetical protein